MVLLLTFELYTSYRSPSIRNFSPETTDNSFIKELYRSRLSALLVSPYAFRFRRWRPNRFSNVIMMYYILIFILEYIVVLILP